MKQEVIPIQMKCLLGDFVFAGTCNNLGFPSLHPWVMSPLGRFCRFGLSVDRSLGMLRWCRSAKCEVWQMNGRCIVWTKMACFEIHLECRCLDRQFLEVALDVWLGPSGGLDNNSAWRLFWHSLLMLGFSVPMCHVSFSNMDMLPFLAWRSGIPQNNEASEGLWRATLKIVVLEKEWQKLSASDHHTGIMGISQKRLFEQWDLHTTSRLHMVWQTNVVVGFPLQQNHPLNVSCHLLRHTHHGDPDVDWTKENLRSRCQII